MRKFVGGAVVVVAIIIWQALSFWSVLDPVLEKLRQSGSAGRLVAGIVTYPALTFILLLVCLVLIVQGIKEIRESRSALPRAVPSSSPMAPIEVRAESNPSQSMSGIKFEQHLHGLHPTPALSPVPKEPEPTPNIRCLGPTSLKLRMGMDGLGFYEQYGEHDAAIVCFRNETSTSKKVAAVRNVRAAIAFFDKTGQEMGTGIAEACWLGDFRSLDFIVEQSHCTVAVIVVDGKVTCPYIRRVPSRWGDQCTTDVYHLDEAPKRIEIRLIKGNDLLLPPCIFDLSVQDGKPILKQRGNLDASALG